MDTLVDTAVRLLVGMVTILYIIGLFPALTLPFSYLVGNEIAVIMWVLVTVFYYLPFMYWVGYQITD